MITTIGIVGLGQIGASIGLTLKAKGGSERILGHDKDSGVQRTAHGLGAVDATASLKDVVKDAQIIFLCLPLGEMRETLSRIGPLLKENTVFFDTTPIKGQVVQWVRESIPTGRYYVGLVPTVNPDLLAKSDVGIKAADAELFQRTTMMVVTLPDTPAGVEQLAMNVARLLGSIAHVDGSSGGGWDHDNGSPAATTCGDGVDRSLHRPEWVEPGGSYMYVTEEIQTPVALSPYVAISSSVDDGANWSSLLSYTYSSTVDKATPGIACSYDGRMLVATFGVGADGTAADDLIVTFSNDYGATFTAATHPGQSISTAYNAQCSNVADEGRYAIRYSTTVDLEEMLYVFDGTGILGSSPAHAYVWPLVFARGGENLYYWGDDADDPEHIRYWALTQGGTSQTVAITSIKARRTL